MAERILLRRDTAANWTTANPVLALGEEGVETDTLRRKIGDGATAWSSLAYATALPADVTAAQAFAVQRANHTGTQTASTISDLGSAVANDPTVKAALGTLTPIAKFGPVGAADDTATFAAAAAAGVPVFVPAGTYRIKDVPVGTGTLFWMAAGVTFKPPTSFVDGSAGMSIFKLWDGDFNSTAHVTDCGLVGGPWVIDYTGYTSTTNVLNGVIVFNAQRWRIENLTVLNSPHGPSVQLAKNDAGTMPEDGVATNIRHIGGAGFGAVQVTSGRRLEFRQLVADEFCPLNFELDFGTYQNSIVEDVVADGLWLERPATAHTVGFQAGVKFAVPSTCRVSRVSVRGVRVLNADGIQFSHRDPYGAGTIEDVTVEDVRVECNGIGHYGIQVDQIDPVRVVVRRLYVTDALTVNGELRGDVTLYDCVGKGAGNDGWRDLAGSAPLRRFYNCSALNSNNGSGFYTGNAARYELYGCTGSDDRGASAAQRQGFNCANTSTALLVGCSFVGNLIRRVYWSSGTVREVDSPDADTNGSIQAAAPTTGLHRKGEVVWNSGATAGGSPGWICVTAGEPGTWKPMANLGA